MLEPVQLAPFATFGAQEPAAQWLPGMQSASAEHVTRQLVAPHPNGAQLVVAAAAHVPAPVHWRAPIATSVVQLAAPHDTEEAG